MRPSPEVSRAAVLQEQVHNQHKQSEPRASCLGERQYLPLLPPERPKGEGYGITQLLNCKCQITIFTSDPATIRCEPEVWAHHTGPCSCSCFCFHQKLGEQELALQGRRQGPE